jgi:small-conductance mechanosensitive channel
VLKFKRALGYIEESHPFGDAFGPAGDRDEAIASAHHVYWQLTKFDGDETTTLLNFDVLALIANSDSGVPVPAKLNALRKLFRPDAHNELTLLAFIQSCDNVYKRLRFLRASVSNSSAIDEVLGSIINCIFGFILALIVLELLDFNPWTLLVSMTSLLVSVSFALGPSVSQFVEVSAVAG